ncbi:hypothetical protein GHO29_05230 [Pseudomonas helleri]|uniref:Uncharacterized protein n=1 Tax=Pseudomonas helleri TaxID=1608996 RepID=A0A6A7YUW7_9PSED|nr:hypothetical protein [Pseudomonas helleri]MQT79317.1 hypothetical protein [Pseudomonas helleri]MQU15067.1 hypothetical protein [Pseudomonas helleri]MQU25884.1 hypothetical protein [Pseudomonas helleri]
MRPCCCENNKYIAESH